MLPTGPFRLAFCPALVVLLLVLTSLSPPHAHAISIHTLFTPTGAAAYDQFGLSVAGAGDVNGDGYDDVIVGALYNDAGGTYAGRAYVYFGGPGADAVADLTLAGAAGDDYFGHSVAGAGDVNGDGYGDVIVGAHGNDAGGTNAGRAYVYFGGPGADASADLILTGAAAGDNFGYSVAGAGDVNGDGYGDVIVGALYNDAGESDAGRAYVYYGGPGADAVADLTLTGAAASDYLGTSVAGAGDVNGDGYGDVIVGASSDDAGGADAGRAYVYYGGPGADAVADLTLTGAAVGDYFGYSVAGAGDVNGDGYGDVIAGALYNDAGGANAGRAYVYYGGPGADAVADLTLTGATGDYLGHSVAGAGDVNGDGYGDVIVGAPFNDAGGGDAGRAYVHFGGPGADAVADLTLTGAAASDYFGRSVAGAGDVNGDGYGDVIVGANGNDAGGTDAGRAYVATAYPYNVLSPNGGEQWVAGTTATVRWLGPDVADIAVSMDGGASYSTLASGVGGATENEFPITVPGIATEFGKVRLSQTGLTVERLTSDASDGVFRIVLPHAPPAAASALACTPTGAAASDNFGNSVAGAGDVNGDGYGDVIIGANNNDAGGTNAGRAYVYFGGPGADAAADLTLTGVAAYDYFGYSVAGAGDVDGDGFGDVLVGAYSNDAGAMDAGQAYVYLGGPGADAVADLTLTGAATGDQFGRSVAGAGDVNGDGYGDVIVGAERDAAGGMYAGRAYVYYGGPGADASADLTLTGAATGDNFGTSVAGAGDVNGDGYDDVIVGACYNDAGGTDAGRAYVYFGGPGADAVADLTLTGAAALDYFGNSVAGAGDVNGDGYDDVIVGAYHNGASGTEAGRAYVYFGGPGADAVADLTLTGAAVGDMFGRSVAGAGDVNGDGYGDVIVGAYHNSASGMYAGRAYVYFGGPGADAVADLIVTGAAALDYFGCSVAGAGDITGDGFGDVIVGAYGNDAGGSSAGRAYVYDCNRYFVTTPNGGETWNVGATQTVSWLGAEPADLWLSTDNGGTYGLLRSEVGGSESNALALLVPHQPTRFARIRLTPHDGGVKGVGESDSSFTIQSSVELLSLVATLEPAGGATLAWSSEPAVGPGGLAGYRVYRLADGETGSGTRVGEELIVTTTYHDAGGAAGSTYRLIAVNGLAEELELGRVTVAGMVTGLQAWPSPLPAGGELQVRFGVPLAAPGYPATDLDVGLFDLAGRRVATLARGLQVTSTGVASLRWNPRGSAGPGIYFLRVTAPSVNFKLERKVVVIP